MSAKNQAAPHQESEAHSTGNGSACECLHLEQNLRDAGARLLDETKGLRAEFARKAQQHPLATFGIAFAAGLLVARALRR